MYTTRLFIQSSYEYTKINILRKSNSTQDKDIILSNILFYKLQKQV